MQQVKIYWKNWILTHLWHTHAHIHTFTSTDMFPLAHTQVRKHKQSTLSWDTILRSTEHNYHTGREGGVLSNWTTGVPPLMNYFSWKTCFFVFCFLIFCFPKHITSFRNKTCGQKECTQRCNRRTPYHYQWVIHTHNFDFQSRVIEANSTGALHAGITTYWLIPSTTSENRRPQMSLTGNLLRGMNLWSIQYPSKKSGVPIKVLVVLRILVNPFSLFNIPSFPCSLHGLSGAKNLYSPLMKFSFTTTHKL